MKKLITIKDENLDSELFEGVLVNASLDSYISNNDSGEYESAMSASYTISTSCSDTVKEVKDLEHTFSLLVDGKPILVNASISYTRKKGKLTYVTFEVNYNENTGEKEENLEVECDKKGMCEYEDINNWKFTSNDPKEDNRQVVIYTDGVKTTTASLTDNNGNVVAKGVAKLHPKDNYNFLEGAKIAFDKLYAVSHVKRLYYKNECYGICGSATSLRIGNTTLQVGDQVLVVSGKDSFNAVIGLYNNKEVLLSNDKVRFFEPKMEIVYVFHTADEIKAEEVFEGVLYR